jgi:hypothetical protein
VFSLRGPLAKHQGAGGVAKSRCILDCGSRASAVTINRHSSRRRSIMGARGRRSAAESNVVALSVTGQPSRLSPPAYLSKLERALFIELTSSLDSRHFIKSDLPLLCSFIQATLVARSGPAKSIEGWQMAVKIQAMLATRLRLAPQARSTPVKVARQAARQADRSVQVPWERQRDG